MENKKIDRCQSFFLSNNFIPKNIINNPTNKFKILETIVGINSERIVPNNATPVKKNNVEETKPIANKTNCLFVNFSSIIFVVSLLSDFLKVTLAPTISPIVFLMSFSNFGAGYSFNLVCSDDCILHCLQRHFTPYSLFQ